MKRFFSSCWILIAAGAAISTASFTACDDDKDSTPVYQPVEMTLCTIEEAYREKPPYHSFVQGSHLVLHSETFPFLAMEGATLTICPLSEKQLFMFGDSNNDDSSSPYPSSTIRFETFFNTESMTRPDFIFGGKKGAMFLFVYFLPSDGDYDFYFRIDCPEKGLYFQTPNYRYTMRLIEGGLYDASITALE